MPYYIQAVHMEPSDASDHEHIAQVQWLEPTRGEINYSNTTAMVKFINDGGDVRVSDGANEVSVGVVAVVLGGLEKRAPQDLCRRHAFTLRMQTKLLELLG